MHNVAEICILWPSDADLARDMGVAYPTVAAWKQRGSIPAMYWRDLIRSAHRRGYHEVTADLLADLHARKAAKGEGPGFSEEDTSAYASPSDIHGPSRSPNHSGPVPGDTGQFTRWKHLRRSNFASSEEIAAHIRALRDEWDRR